MASKKDQKKKNKGKKLGAENMAPNPFLQSGTELNSLDLLSTLYSVPKATEGNSHSKDAASPENDPAITTGSEEEPTDRLIPEADDTERQEAEAMEKARREAEEAERRRQEEEKKRQRKEAEAAEQARREAEEAERRRQEEEARRQAEEEERQRKEAEAAEQARREAEEAERRRQEEEARRLAEEERQRKEAEAAEQARREAEEAERRRQEEEARRLAEEERQRKEAEAAEQARREAEEAERRRQEEEARRLAEEEERQRKEAEAAEQARREAEEAERRRQEEEARRQAEEKERQRKEAEAAEQARREAEEARKLEDERLEKEAEMAEKARRDAEDDAARQAEEAERRHQEDLAAARARRLAEDAEQARKTAIRMRQETPPQSTPAPPPSPASSTERPRAVPARERRDEAVPAAPIAGGPPQTAAPLEVDNPFWKKPPEIFDVLSGAPHGVPPAGTPSYVPTRDAGVLPVTMASGAMQAPDVNHRFEPLESYDESSPFRLSEASLESYAVPPEKRMYIVMITPEVAPAAKVGGLGDVILGLGRELMKRGHGVEVICPMYSCMRYDEIQDMHEEYSELWCPHYDEWRPEKVFQGKVGGELQVNFITGGTYTERPSIYGFDDDLQRFTYFSRAALEFMYKTNRRPDVIHCHDWATGLVAPILWDIYEKLGWNNSRVVYTIHNNECQGLCGFGDKLLSLAGLDIKNYMRPDRMQDDTHKNCINMMKAGVVYSNFVTTVSPTFAGELKSVSGGRGLQTTFAKNSAKLGGVLNGIDYTSWDPKTDSKLAARYSEGEDFFEKYKNKIALREWLGMWDAWRPIISVVTRLTHQKGLDLIKHAIYSAKKLQAQFVLLGSAPDPKVNDDFLRIQHEFKDDHDINLYIGYHEDLSRLIYAGSDMFLVPSLYEPCGLTQMISLRYGTVPVVRETGGLVDTVFDLDNSGRGLNTANGFTFRDANAASLDYGLERAVRLWYDNPEAFNRVARNGMKYDYSWRHPTEHYENIYHYIKA